MKQTSFWVYCPICRSKTRIKIYRETVVTNFPLYCPKCRQETIVEIKQLNLSIIEPDALDAEPMDL